MKYCHRNATAMFDMSITKTTLIIKYSVGYDSYLLFHCFDPKAQVR